MYFHHITVDLAKVVCLKNMVARKRHNTTFYLHKKHSKYRCRRGKIPFIWLQITSTKRFLNRFQVPWDKFITYPKSAEIGFGEIRFFSRWRSIWPPLYLNHYNSMTIYDSQMVLVSSRRNSKDLSD